MTIALTAGEATIATLAGFTCLVAVVIAVIDTVHMWRTERQVKRDALRLAALRDQEFERDHPDRKRIGLKGDE